MKILLKDMLEETWKKEDIRRWAEMLGIPVYRKKTASLAKEIAESLLAEMPQRMSVLHQDEFAYFEHCVKAAPFEKNSYEEDLLKAVVNTDYVYVCNNEVILPEDVRQRFTELNTLQFRKYRKLASYLLDVLKAVRYLYMVIPCEELAGCFQGKYAVLKNPDVFRTCWDMIHPADNPCVIRDGLVIDKAAEDTAEEICAERGNMPFSFPSPEEIIDIARYGFSLHSPEAQRYIAWLRETGFEASYARECAGQIAACIAEGGTKEDAQNLLRQLSDPDEEISYPAKIRTDAFCSDVRTFMLAGASEAEIEAAKLRNQSVQGNGEVLSADTVIDAVHLITQRPVLEKLGYDVQVEKKAEYINVVFFDGKKKRTVKTIIFPDDPCPCGSGKTFRMCHGKKMS